MKTRTMLCRRDISILAEIKLNNACQVINQEIYRLLIDALHETGPEKFLRTRFDLYFQEEPGPAILDFGDSDDSFEETYGRLLVKFSGTVKFADLESGEISSSQQAEGVDTSSEVFNGSQGSCSYSLVQGNAASLAPDSQGSWNSQSSSSYSLLQRTNPRTAPMTGYSHVHGHASSFGSADTTCSPPSRVYHKPKRSYRRAFGKNRNTKRLSGKYDPENHEIMRLRQEENLDFQEIADRLNKARSSAKNGIKDDLTDNAIYSRYTRNAPLIAQMRNEKFLPTAKDNQYTKMKFPIVEPISGFNPDEDALLELAEEQIEEQFWVMVSKRIEELGGRFHDPEMCERRFDCL